MLNIPTPQDTEINLEPLESILKLLRFNSMM